MEQLTSPQPLRVFYIGQVFVYGSNLDKHYYSNNYTELMQDKTWSDSQARI